MSDEHERRRKRITTSNRRTNVSAAATLLPLLPLLPVCTAQYFTLVDAPTRQQYPFLGFLPWPATLLVQAGILIGALVLALVLPRIRPALSDWLLDTSQWLRDTFADLISMAGATTNGFFQSVAASSPLGLIFGRGPNLFPGHSSSASRNAPHLRRKQPLRPTTAAGFVAAAQSQATTAPTASGSHYPGLVNTGNTCFFNSVVQSLSSCTPFVEHIQQLHGIADQIDVPTPVVDALLELLTALNTPSTSRRGAIRPQALTSALSIVSQNSSLRSLLMAHQQQDAHELLLLLLDALSLERRAVLQELNEAEGAARGSGLAGILGKTITTSALSNPYANARRSLQNPCGSLVAQRTACVRCGYYDSIHNTVQEELGLNVPVRRWGGGGVSLGDCLDEWASLEGVEWRCWRCTLQYNRHLVEADVRELQQRYEAGGAQTASQRKKNKKKKKRKAAAAKAAVNGNASGESARGHPNGDDDVVHVNGDRDGGDVDVDVDGADGSSERGTSVEPANADGPTPPLPPPPPKLQAALALYEGITTALALDQNEDLFNALHPSTRLERPPTLPGNPPTGTKQMLFSRPPSVLPIHLNRSLYYGMGAGKNHTSVRFGEWLDLSRWCISDEGVESEPTRAMNAVRGATMEQEDVGWATVGGGNAGLGKDAFAAAVNGSLPHATTPPRDSSRAMYRLDSIVVHYGAHSFGHYVSYRRRPGKSDHNGDDSDDVVDDEGYLPAARPDWLRISDDSVQTCTLPEVLSQEAFLLFYRRVDSSASGPPSVPRTATSEYWTKTRPRSVAAWQLRGVGDDKGDGRRGLQVDADADAGAAPLVNGHCNGVGGGDGVHSRNATANGHGHGV